MSPIAAGGRAEGSVLLRRRGCSLISSHQSPVPGRGSASLFRAALPACLPQPHTLLPPELASVHFNGRGQNPVFPELAALCLSPRPCLGWCLCVSISQLGCGMLLFVPRMDSLSCLSCLLAFLAPARTCQSSLTSFLPLSTRHFLPYSLFLVLKLSELLSLCPSLLIKSL